MAHGLYDTGKPLHVIVDNPPEPGRELAPRERVIVERVVERQTTVILPVCLDCRQATRSIPCEHCQGRRIAQQEVASLPAREHKQLNPPEE